MPTPYDAAANDLFSGNLAIGARTAVTTVADRNPDAEADVQRRAKLLGTPYESARAHPAVVDQRVAGAAVDYDNLARQAPRTSRFLASTSNAAIAHDDIGVLGLIEKSLRLFADPVGSIGSLAPLAGNVARYAAQQTAQEVKAKGGPAGYLKALGRDVGPENIGRHTVKGGLQMISGLLGTVEGSQEAAEKVDLTAGLQQRLFGGTIEQGLAGLSRQARRAIDRKANEVAPNDAETTVGGGVQMGIESIPLSIGALAATILTDGVAPGLALIGGTTYGQSYGQARDAGFSVGRATAKSAIDALVEMGTEYFPEKYFLKDVHGHAGFGKFLVDQLKSEVPGEQAATLLQDFNQWATLDANQGKSFEDYAKEILPHALQTLIATGVGIGATAGVGGVATGVARLAGREQRASQAQAVTEQIEEMGKLAAASKLRERSPDTFHALVDEMADGSPADTVYVAPEALANALFQSGFDEEQSKAVDNTFGPRIKDALEQGTDVAVPVAEFATHIAGTPAEKALIDHIKVDPNGMTRAEAEEFMATKGEALKAEIEKELAQQEGDTSHAQEVDKVRQVVLDELNKANRFTPKVNERYADLHAAFFGTMARRLGVSPNTLYERYPLRIVNRAMPDSQLEQSGLRTAIAGAAALATAQPTHATPAQSAPTEQVAPVGLRAPGNIDIHSRPVVHNKDGTISTVRSISIGTDQGEVLIPTVVAGKVVSDKAAIQHYQQTGEHLGIFDTPEHATAYAKALHEQQAQEYHQSDEAPIFYSELEKAVENSKQAKASPDQWLATLSKTPGVKKEEIEWTELPEWLATQDGPVTREELLAFVRAGGVQVEEVDLAGDDFRRAEDIYDIEVPAAADENPIWRVYDRGTGSTYAEFDNEEDAYEWIRNTEEFNGEDSGAQFSAYTEDGGEDYHELLLTLPPGVRGNPERAPSTHFDEPGVVAHLRFKTRQTTDGKKLLFIEEVQSDWHQKGRDQGYEQYADPEEVRRNMQAFRDAAAADESATQALVDLAARFIPGDEFEDMPNTRYRVGLAENALRAFRETDDGHRHRDEINAALLLASETNLRRAEAANAVTKEKEGIPDAPFKATWPALVMKRAIRWAADNGFEAVAWTTGEQQRERYNLADSVGTIDVRKQPGGYQVILQPQISRAIVERGLGESMAGTSTLLMTPEQIGEVFGKDLGSRMMALADQSGEKLVTLRDDDLKIGGEGMLAFYDRNLVNITNNILKKLGGAKVEMLPVEGMGETEEVRIARQEFRHIRDSEFGGITDMVDVPMIISHYEEMAGRHEPGSALHDEYQRYVDKMRNIKPEDFKPVKEAEQRLRDAEAQGTNPGFTITPEMAQHAREGFALFQKNRGAYSPASDTISLLEHADLSTFLHESGHFYLEVLSRMADDPSAPQQVKDDFAALLDWFGVKDQASWNAMSLEDKRKSHEKFARGFEAYLFTGRAPASRLRDLFRTFRSWLVAVYRHARNLGVNPTAQVRQVMDRLLASDEEIADAQAARSMEPLFKDQATSGMSEEQWKDYQRANASATTEASDDLARRSLRDLKWFENARSREVNRLKRQADAIRKATRARVAAEVAQEPVYRAQQYLKRGVLDGETAEGPHKLSIESVDRVLVGNANAGEVKRKLGYGKYGILAEQGLDVEATAQVFGFTSGDHMVQALTTAEPMRDRIAGIAEQRLLQENGDLTDPQSIEEAASEAVHNEFRARAVAAELAALAKASGKPRLLAQAARQFAEDTVARTRVRDLKPGKYEAAASRAAKAALKALGEGNLAQAALEKRNQLFNLYATKGAIKAKDEVDKALRLFDRLTRPAAAKSLDASYRDQIVQLLDRYDLNRGATLKSIDKRTSLAEWVERQREQGFDPAVPDDLLNDAAKRSYKQLTVEELRGLVDTVKSIEHLGRLKSKLLTAKKDRDFASAVDRAASTIIGNAVSFKRPKVERNSWADKAKAGVFDFLALHRKFASLIRQMDGHRDGGPLWELFVRPMNAAGDREVQMRHDATAKLIEIMQPIASENMTRKQLIPELGASLSLEGRLAVAFNMGNETNRARLRDGDNWTDEQIDAIGATLTAEQWSVVQGVWDFINSYWPEIAAKQRRVTGVEPEKVEGDPFQVVTADGQTLQLPGGYYPIKYDTDRSTRSEADDASEIAKAMLRGAYTRATTKRGHTQARVDTVKRPIRKDIGVIGQHLTEVIHDLSWHEYLIDANRLLGSAAIDGAVRDHYGPEVLRAMRNTLTDVAAGDIPAHNFFERSVNYLRTGATIAGMGWSMTTALLQPLGLAQSIKRIGFKPVAKGMGRWIGDSARLQSTVKWITEQSPMMAQRANTLQREISEIRNSVVKGKGSAANEAVKASFFYLIAKLQLVADVPTWIGQYQKSIDGGEEHDRAVALADQAVLDAQGGGQIKDQAGIQRGGPLLKVWTNFYSYFSVTYNLMAESVAETRLVGSSRLPLLAADYVLLFVVPAVMQTLMFDLGRGDDKDWPEIAEDVGISVLMAPLQSMVLIRDIAAALTGDQRSVAPAGIVMRQMVNLGVQAKQGEADEAFWKALNQVTGILLHYPAAQVQRTALGIQALANGDTHNPAAVLLGPPQQQRHHRH